MKIISKNIKNLFPLFLVLVFLFSISASACSNIRQEDPVPAGDDFTDLLPDAQKDVEELPEIPHYNIQVKLDYPNASYSGTALIDYTNLEDVSLESIYFRLFPNSGRAYGNGSLEVSSIKVDGLDARTILSLEDSVLEVKLPQPLQAGEHIQVTFDFDGRVPHDFDGDGYGIFNLSQDVISLAGWFPIVPVFDDEGWNLDPSSNIGDSVYADMAHYDIELTAPDKLILASTGIQIDSKEISGSLVVYNLTSRASRDFVLVLGQDFQVVSKSVQGTIINTYYLPDHKEAASDTLETAVNALKIFNEKFGPYPYTELDIIDAPMNGYIAVEFPGIVLIGSRLYGDTMFTVHEIAHQWWYNVVGNDVVDDPWLDEALTTYSSVIFFEFIESKNDSQQIIGYFEIEHKENVDSGGEDIITEGLDHFEGLGPDHYSLAVYVKGALFFHSLRNTIGNKAFFTALQEYYQLKKYRIASPDDLLGQFEKASGIKLDELYQEWLYSK